MYCIACTLDRWTSAAAKAAFTSSRFCAIGQQTGLGGELAGGGSNFINDMKLGDSAEPFPPLRGGAGCSGVVFGGPPGAHMLHLNQKAKRYSCRGGKYASSDVLGFLRFDPSPEICSQTSPYSTSHWAHAVQQRWCIELRLHQILEKCC